MTDTPKILGRTPVKFAGEDAGLEKYFRLEKLRISDGGVHSEHLIWRRGEFVQIVALTDEEKLVLIREHKKAINEWILGIPAGAVAKGEGPIEAALRELKEETGYEGDAKNALVVSVYYNNPDKSTEKHHVVLIRKVRKTCEPANLGEAIQQVQPVCAADMVFRLKIALHKLALKASLDLMKLTNL